MRPTVTLLLAVVAAGCYDSGGEFAPEVTDVPGIVDLGQIQNISVDDWRDPDFDPRDPSSGVVYAQVGADSDPSVTGGATFQFSGNGNPVCVLMDPETVFWSRVLNEGSTGFLFDDNYDDDADLDMDVGLTAYYTGSPGVEIGNFNAEYTDAAGLPHNLAANECVQSGYTGEAVHPGRGSVESCPISTQERGGVSFTGVIRTFQLPTSDSIANFALAVVEVPGPDRSACSALSVDECTLPDEHGLGVADDRSEVEAAFCDGARKVNDYCEAHLDDENPPCKPPTE